MSDAIGAFALSQTPRLNRIALVLAGIFGGVAEDLLPQAADLEQYVDSDFTKPYKAVTTETI